MRRNVVFNSYEELLEVVSISNLYTLSDDELFSVKVYMVRIHDTFKKMKELDGVNAEDIYFFFENYQLIKALEAEVLRRYAEEARKEAALLFEPLENSDEFKTPDQLDEEEVLNGIDQRPLRELCNIPEDIDDVPEEEKVGEFYEFPA